VVTKG